MNVRRIITATIASIAFATLGAAGVANAVPPKCEKAWAVKSVVCGTATGSEGPGATTQTGDLPTKPADTLPSYKGYDREKNEFVWK